MRPTREPASPRELLAAAIEEFEALAREGRRPTRYDARALLIPLGRILIEEGKQAAQAEVARIRAVQDAPLRGWRRAVREELALAAAEHVRGVDPRFLSHPRYDFTYTLGARERLEQRLRAAEALGIAPSEDLLERVAEADRLLDEARGADSDRGQTP